jgi:hypothetical protein
MEQAGQLTGNAIPDRPAAIIQRFEITK